MHSVRSSLRMRLAEQLHGRILDCGSGEDLFGPILRREGNKVISLDIDEAELAKTPNLAVVASCAEMPFVDDYFDAVWACAIIEHVAEDTLPEMIRVTRPGGRVIAVTPNCHSPFDPLKRWAGYRTWWECDGHVRLYTTQELRRFGDVIGESWWLPGMGWFFRRVPQFAHVLIVDIHVTPELKARMAKEFPATYAPRGLAAARVCL